MNSQNKLIILVAAVIIVFGSLAAVGLTIHDADDSTAENSPAIGTS